MIIYSDRASIFLNSESSYASHSRCSILNLPLDVHVESARFLSDDPESARNDDLYGNLLDSFDVQVTLRKPAETSRALDYLSLGQDINFVDLGSDSCTDVGPVSAPGTNGGQSESESLEKFLKNQQAFIAQLTHELRTPLAIAVGSLRRASLRSTEIPSNSAEHMQVASQELKRMARLIDHLTLLTDIDTGSQRWSIRSVSVADILVLWLEQISDQARQRLVVSVNENLSQVIFDVDPEALIIVLNNLLDNSLRYSPEDSPVVLLVEEKSECVRFFIADWGYGIPQNLLEHVFDRFRRLEEHRDPSRADGSGLGLAVSRSLLGLMNGQISFLPHDSVGIPDSPSTVAQLSISGRKDPGELCPRQLGKGLELENPQKAYAAGRLFAYLERIDEFNGGDLLWLN